MENYFLDNIGRGIVDIQSRWSTSIMLTSNFLQRNVLEKSAIIVTALQGSNSDISLLHNRFFNNTAEKLVDVTENSAMVVIRNNIMVHNEVDKSIINLVTENSDRVSSFNFTRNSLIANGLRPRYLSLPSNAINNVAAVICSSRQISVNENFFENPLFPWEFMLTPFFEPYEIDGKYNWWGSKDVKEIILKIFDFRWRNYLPRLKFSPFLASANLTDVSTGETRVTFRNGNVLGGHVTDYILLEKDSSPYTVIRDVVIYPNATLTIEKGVQINVFPDIGFHVYGKLELLGERNTPIQFDITTKFIKDFANFGAYPLRLVNGSKSWEGIVEIFYNNTWGTICDDGNSNSNGIVLCEQLGYQSYSGGYSYTPSSSSTTPVWWRYLRCNPNIHHDISTCSFDGWGVSCYGGLWTVRCDPGYWRGIRFRETAKASQISHVKFERGGGQIRNDISSYVLHFDVLRQALSDVAIHDPFRGGIKIIFQEPGFVINNILIQNHKDHWPWYNGGIGIETSSALTCYNCSVFGTYRGFYFPEFNIQNFLYEIEIKQVDFLVAPTFMLRKEIPMCEQNMSVIIGMDDMKIITMSKSSYSYQDVECFLTLSILSRINLVAAEISLSPVETFTISKSNLNSSNGTEFTLRQHDVYIIGPGNLTLRYWRKAWSSGSRKRLVIFSSEGNMSLKLVVFNHTSKVWVLDYRV
jgi:deleted-in-malignant-brain-tumors protein 1